MIRITVNGEARETSVAGVEELLVELSLPAPLMLVEHNGKALHRSEWPAIRLNEGDRLELMKVAAGG
jgi:sulfur carrier protein